MENKKLFDLKVGDHFYFIDDRFKREWYVDFIDLESKVNYFNMKSELGTFYLYNEANTIKAEVKNRGVVYIKNDKSKCTFIAMGSSFD